MDFCLFDNIKTIKKARAVKTSFMLGILKGTISNTVGETQYAKVILLEPYPDKCGKVLS